MKYKYMFKYIVDSYFMIQLVSSAWQCQYYILHNIFKIGCGDRGTNPAVAIGVRIRLWRSRHESGCGDRGTNPAVAIGVRIRLWRSGYESGCGDRGTNPAVAIGVRIRLWRSGYESGCGDRGTNPAVAVKFDIAGLLLFFWKL